MKPESYILVILLFCFTYVGFSQEFYNDDAKKINKNAKYVKIDKQSKTIKHIKFSKGIKDARKASVKSEFLRDNLGLSKEHSFVNKKTSKDKIGQQHVKFNQYINGVKVDGKTFTLHYSGSDVVSGSGDYIDIPSFETKPSIDFKGAFKLALEHIDAKKYIWEEDQSIDILNLGELVVVDHEDKYFLAYKFDIFASDPMSRNYVYIDAKSGKFIKKQSRIVNIERDGIAETMYSGTKVITTDSVGVLFRLQEYSRGAGIFTYDLNNSTSYSSAVDFTDTDNYWDDVTNFDNAAYDAHIGTEATYDYYLNEHGRNSFDDAGSALISYVHYSSGYANAFWNGSYMTYGDGDGVNTFPLTCIDIIAHEITHGVTEYSADLVYSYESGALNESFSDIFGTCTDFYLNPGTANWQLGEQISASNTPIRSLSDPNSLSDPDTYQGNYWYSGSGDNGGVHTNSSVMNHWFYLLANGGTGTNDYGNAYNITGIGMDKAAAIAYRNLTVYLTTYSQYSDARYFAIQSAIDLYGACSQEVISTTNAWNAVGVGNQYNNSVLANFRASQVYSCMYPASIQFYNLSTNSSTYLWDFDDGSTSTDSIPSHTYSSPGLYDVRLIASGSAACNTVDTITKLNYINITDEGGPVPSICSPSTLYPGNYGITRFVFDSIDNVSGPSGEGSQDYSCEFKTTLMEGRSYPIEVYTNYSTPENVWAWLDLDTNGVFDHASELIYISYGKFGTHMDTVIIPQGSVYDIPLRLRVASDRYTNVISNPCNDLDYGHFEDYTVLLKENKTVPIAGFMVDTSMLKCGGSICFSDKSLNLPSSREWHFPGGTPSVSTDQNPTITYNSAGKYSVELVVSNAQGVDTLVRDNYIIVTNEYILGTDTESTEIAGKLFDSGGPSDRYSNSENYSFLIQPECADTIELTFNQFNLEGCCDYFRVYDGDNEYAPLLISRNGSSLPNNVKASSGSMFIKFTSDGSVTYSGFDVSWDTELKSTGLAPLADFIFSDSIPPLKKEVQFTDQTTEGPVSWLWNFGDGNMSVEQSPLHSYETSGIKDITLISSTCYTSDTILKSLTVQRPPISTITPDSIYVELFTGDSLTETITINNSFGNGDLIYSTTISGNELSPLYLKFKNNSLTTVNGDENNQGMGIRGPIPIDEIDKLEGTTEILSWVYYADMSTAYPNTLNAISQYYTNYNITTTTTTDATSLNALLQGKDILLIPEQEGGSSSFYVNLGSTWATVLTEFVENGGSVIVCGQGNGAHEILNTSGLLYMDYYNLLSYDEMNLEDYRHALVEGISLPLIAQSAVMSCNVFDQDAETIVSCYGYSCIVTKEIGFGKVIYLGYDFYNYDDNAAIIISNAVQWTGSSNNWISVSPDSGIVLNSGLFDLDVNLNATGMFGGLYTSNITILSNDSLNPEVRVPVYINVTGAADIGISTDTLSFGQIYTGVRDTMELEISNNGTDTLLISNIVSDNPFYTIDTNKCSVLWNEQETVKIIFSPTSVSYETGNISIFSNDSSQLETVIFIEGSGVEPPLMINNDSILAQVTTCNDSVIVPYAIVNNGGSDLEFQILGLNGYSETSLKYFSNTGASTYHYFNDLPINADSLTIDVTINGDYDLSSEYVDLFIDGENVGRMDGGDTYMDITQRFNFNGSQVSNWLADKSIEVVLDNSSAVNPGYGTDLHQVKLQMEGVLSLNLSTDSSIVEAGDTVMLEAMFKSEGLNTGTYTDTLVILSNDPTNNRDTVVSYFTVIGSPIIAFSDSSLNFGEQFIGTPGKDSITIYNQGCDTLHISNISSSESNFSADTSYLSVLPGASFNLAVSFNPSSEGEITGLLNISNNDIDTVVYLSGIGAYPPEISINPERIKVKVNAGFDTIQNLAISNLGLSDLQFEINANLLKDKKVYFITQSGRDSAQIEFLENQGIKVQKFWSQYGMAYEPQDTIDKLNNADLVIIGRDGASANYGSPNKEIWNAFTCPIILTHPWAARSTRLNWFNTSSCMHVNNVSETIYAKVGDHTDPVFQNATFTGDSMDWSYAPDDCLELYQPSNAAQLAISSQYNSVLLARFTQGTEFYPGSVDTVIAQRTYLGFGNEDLGYPNYFPLTINARTVYFAEICRLLNVPIKRPTVEFRGIDNSSNWLSSTPNLDTVSPGGTSNIDVTLSAQGLNAGIYSSEMVISNNDPSNNQVVIPVEMEVVGNPSINISKDSINFGDVFVGLTYSDSIVVSNTGSDTLFVNDITCGSTEFTTNISSFSIAPDEFQLVEIVYNPTIIADTIAYLFFESNDTLNVRDSIVLTATSYNPPVIALSSDSLGASVLVGDSVMQKLTITNSGGYNLEVNIDITNQRGSTITDQFNLASIKEIISDNPDILHYQIGTDEVIFDYNSSDNIDGEMVENKGRASLALSDDLSDMVVICRNGLRIFTSELEMLGANVINMSYLVDEEMLDSIDIMVVNDYFVSRSGVAESVVRNWIIEGGSLIIDADDDIESFNAIISGSGITYLNNYSNSALVSHIYPHDVTDTISKYFIGSNAMASLSVGNEASILIKDNYNNIYAAAAELGKGKIVAIGDESLATTDYNHQELGINAVKWFANKNNNYTSWLSCNDNNFNVPAGSSTDVEVKFNATEMELGSYNKALVLKTNDPVNSVNELKAHMDVASCHPVEVQVSENICYGDSIVIGDYAFKSTGNYTVNLTKQDGCDSTVYLDLIVNQADHVYVITQICQGKDVTIGDQVFNESGNYTVTLENKNWCDSIVHLDLTVAPPVQTYVSETICFGEKYNIGDLIFTKTGNYKVTLANVEGCDSVVNLNLTVNPVDEVEVYDTICEGGFVKIGKLMFSETGSYEVVLRNQFGCDSIVHLDLLVNPVDIVNMSDTICQGESITIGNEVFEETGVYEIVLSNRFGCDSTIILDLTVNPSDEINIEEAICSGDSVKVGGLYYDKEGSYTMALSNIYGCDSLISLDLKMNYPNEVSFVQSICAGDSILIGENYYKEEGNYAVELSNVYGCDSIVNADLKLLPIKVTELNETICKGDSVEIGSYYYKDEGQYSVTMSSFIGCDSIVNLDLILNFPDVVSFAKSICTGDSVMIGNTYFKQEGSYVVELSNIYGCDSIIQLDLVENALPELSLGNDTVVQEPMLLDAGPGFAEYQWSGGSTQQTILLDDSYGVGDHVIAVMVTDINGCYNSDTIYISIQATNMISNTVQEVIKIFPNPTKGKLHFTIPEVESNVLLELVTVDGKVLLNKVLHPNESKDQTLDISQFHDGIYLLRISNNEKQAKVILRKE